MPNGAAWYAYNVRTTTTTDMTPAQIHQLGLDEVARIHGEIGEVMKQVKFKGSLQDFFKYMRSDKQFQFKSRGRAARRTTAASKREVNQAFRNSSR